MSERDGDKERETERQRERERRKAGFIMADLVRFTGFSG